MGIKFWWYIGTKFLESNLAVYIKILSVHTLFVLLECITREQSEIGQKFIYK